MFPTYWRLFTVLVVSFAVKKLLSLIELLLLSVPFLSTHKKNHYQYLSVCMSLSLFFFACSFMLLGFTLRSCIHFEIIFILGLH